MSLPFVIGTNNHRKRDALLTKWFGGVLFASNEPITSKQYYEEVASRDWPKIVSKMCLDEVTSFF
jgi:hypothetical protein